MSGLRLIKGGAQSITDQANAPEAVTPLSNITAQHKKSFDSLRDPVMRGADANVALASCFVNGEPTAAIVEITKHSDHEFLVTPIWVAVTPGMILTNHTGEEATATPPSKI